jgi:hypothetical protein
MTKKRGPTKAELLRAAISGISAPANQLGGPMLQAWLDQRPFLYNLYDGMRCRTGRRTKRDQVLDRLDELAAGGPITTDLKRKVAAEFKQPLWRITRWNNERN